MPSFSHFITLSPYGNSINAGHVHAFWLIYKKMKAEEKFGLNGFVYIGSGKYEAKPGAQINVPPPNVSLKYNLGLRCYLLLTCIDLLFSSMALCHNRAFRPQLSLRDFKRLATKRITNATKDNGYIIPHILTLRS